MFYHVIGMCFSSSSSVRFTCALVEAPNNIDFMFLKLTIYSIASLGGTVLATMIDIANVEKGFGPQRFLIGRNMVVHPEAYLIWCKTNN